MGKTLILTEKPSVAQEYARILHVSGKNDGFIENEKYVITWCVGHLITLSYPQAYDPKLEKWDIEDLPFLPKNYKYETIENVKKQYDVVSYMLHRKDIDTVLWAGDSGREGQVIEEYIRMYSGVGSWMTEKRIWIDSCTEEEIKRGINCAKPMSEYKNIADAGIMRAIEDYAVGINFTRAFTQMFKDVYSVAKDSALAIGRVLTCVTGMVVDREREIRNFKETLFYRIVGIHKDVELEWKAEEGSSYFESPKLYKENGFKQKSDAEDFVSTLSGKDMEIKKVEKKTEKRNAPFLYNLAELQNDCAVKLKFSPSQTLVVAQSLYEKKLTTYPRTDARVLSSAIAGDIEDNIKGLETIPSFKPFVDNILSSQTYERIAKTKYTNDKAITDHYAIIPTGNTSVDLSSLSTNEYDVYMLICQRFLSIFYPSAEYEKISVKGSIGNENFYTSSRKLTKAGYLEIVGYDKEKETDAKSAILETFKEGEVVSPSIDIRTGKTTPPKRYNTGTFILAMENAGQLIEDEELRQQIKGCGIGTSATRAEILSKAYKNRYIRIDEKTQLIYADFAGEVCYEIVKSCLSEFLNPRLTAEWEKGLEDIANGTENKDDYKEKLEDYVREGVEKIKNASVNDLLTDRIKQIAKNYHSPMQDNVCPLCKKPLKKASWGYYCSGYKEKTCDFRISSEICGVTLSDAQLNKLLTKGATDFINGFSKKGTDEKFSSALISEITTDETGKKTFTIKFARNKDTEYKCLKCGAPMVKNFKGYSCSNYKETGCNFGFLGIVAGKKLSETNVKDLFTKQKTDVIDGFKKKDKTSTFKARLKFDTDFKLAFDFSEEESDLRCPLCGKNLLDGTSVMKCDCGFILYKKIGKKLLSSKNIRDLIKGDRTDLIKGFTSKDGKKFDAKLYLDNEGNVKYEFPKKKKRNFS